MSDMIFLRLDVVPRLLADLYSQRDLPADVWQKLAVAQLRAAGDVCADAHLLQSETDRSPRGDRLDGKLAVRGLDDIMAREVALAFSEDFLVNVSNIVATYMRLCLAKLLVYRLREDVQQIARLHLAQIKAYTSDPGEIEKLIQREAGTANTEVENATPPVNQGSTGILRMGKMPVQLYCLIRQRSQKIRELETCTRLPVQQRARLLGIPRTSYSRAREFIAEHSVQVAAAETSGDWTTIEDILFARFGVYRLMPFFKELCQDFGDPVPEPPADLLLARKSGKERRPAKGTSRFGRSGTTVVTDPGTASDPTRHQLDRWIRIGKAADRLLKPEYRQFLLEQEPAK